MPRKMRQLARKSALNARAKEQALNVVAPLSFDAPKTKRMAELLGSMGLDGHKVLVLTGELNQNVLLSARNIPGVAVMRYADASTYDILRADSIVIEEGALGGELEQGGELEAPVRAEKKMKREAGPEGKAPEAGKKKATAKKAAKPVKAAAPKAAAKKKTAAKAEKPKAAAKKPAAKKPAAKKKKKD